MKSLVMPAIPRFIHMPTLFLVLLMGLTLGGLLGCVAGSAMSNNSAMAQIAVQYATAKVIEQSDAITPEGVIAYVELARTIAGDDVALDPAKIAEQILQALDAQALSPADRVLASALVMQIQAQFTELDLLDPTTRVTLLAVLDWIEQAARLSQ